MTVVFARDEHTGILAVLRMVNSSSAITVKVTRCRTHRQTEISLCVISSIISRWASGAKLCNGCTI